MYNSIIEILDALEDIKRDAKTGRCNEKGLSSKFLIDHLREIESNKDGIAPIFASWEWHKYYFYEMCSIAINEDELWITIRLPIVVLSEELIRTVPLSNQRWIKHSFNEIGYDTTLFKFRENTQYIVPLDIDHDRVLIITNSIKTNTSAQTLCSDNWSSAQQVTIEGHTVVKIPESCSLVSKSFEISKKLRHDNIAINSVVGQVMNVEMRLLKETELKKPNLRDFTTLPPLSDAVERNNNLTKEKLNEIEFKPWSHERIILASSSSITLVLLIITTVILILYCAKKCRNNSLETKGDIVLNINESRGNDTDCNMRNNSAQNISDNVNDPMINNKSHEAAKLSDVDEIMKPLKSQFKR